ncbi:GAF domain-containing protein [Nocardioides jensenii]|uniref:GAF domain-containing protein n=1 Tax=Nocardioides jensenii TaxID=1843 RepID=UPI001FE188DE|nr:GAF domain-containing protein [Nocardioides jensenii]
MPALKTRFTEEMTSDGMRAQVAESWHRSAAAGVRADDAEAPITLPEDSLRGHREAHPLAQVFPLLDDVLGQAARDCDAVMAVSDASAQLLWVCGHPQVLRKAEKIGFVEGSNWDERFAGTNAPGMALALGHPVSIMGSEHFRHSVRSWSCAASPIHDPTTGELLGVLDVTGGDELVVPQTMAMVRAAARMAETELAHHKLTASTAPPEVRRKSGFGLTIQGLGRNEALLEIDDGSGRRSTLRLSPRHSELVLLLGSAPRGLSGDELAVLLYEEDNSGSTLRAELNRLRNLLGDDLLASRPYRLAADVSADWLALEARIVNGDVAGAVRAYRGPLLPRSTAPGVVRLREGIDSTVRQAVLSSGVPDLMSTWTRSSWGTDDYDMWVAQRQAVGPHSPLLPLITGQIDRLDRELA